MNLSIFMREVPRERGKHCGDSPALGDRRFQTVNIQSGRAYAEGDGVGGDEMEEGDDGHGV